jgi:hypothetical protein
MRTRMFALTLAASGLCLFAGGPSASAAGGSCPGGAWEAWTIEDAVEYKLALGYPLTREELLVAANAVDMNDDGIVCLFDLPDSPGTPAYVGLVADNFVPVQAN